MFLSRPNHVIGPATGTNVSVCESAGISAGPHCAEGWEFKWLTTAYAGSNCSTVESVENASLKTSTSAESARLSVTGS